jgi:hypothetical protein
MNFDIKKIRSLMSRIDESYDGYDEFGNPKTIVDDTEDDVSSDNAVVQGQEEPIISKATARVKQKPAQGVFADLVGQDKPFQTIEFLKEPYTDADFDKFFAITTSSLNSKMINNIASTVLGNQNGENGEYTRDFGYGQHVSGISKFLLPKDNSSAKITFFDAIYMFGLLLRTGINGANKGEGGYVEGPHWDNLYSKGYGQVNEAPTYSNMISFINEFGEFPILQGYLKEAYHKTSAGKVKVNEGRVAKGETKDLSLRRVIKDKIIEFCPNEIKLVSPCSKTIYDNKGAGIIYIPYLDKIDENPDRAEQIAIEILGKLREAIEDGNPYASRVGKSDLEFWSEWASKNGIYPENDVITASGLDSITDEMINRLRVLIAREGDANKTREVDIDTRNGNPEARERRANIIAPSYDIAKKLGTDMGMLVSQEDIQEMRSHTLGEWLDIQQERAKIGQDVASKLNASGPFTLAALEKLNQKLIDSGFDVNDNRAEANAFDFFKAYSLASKDSKAERRLLEACKALLGDMWYKFENTKTATSLARANGLEELAMYMESLGVTDKSTKKLSFDMLAYNDTEDGLRNFAAIEYQGEQHYRPNATASISVDDLYNANFVQEENEGIKNWPGYWSVISAIIDVANGWGQEKQEVNESQIITHKTDRKGFLRSCVKALEMAISGEDEGLLNKIVSERCDGYTFDEGYEDTFNDWVRKDRPADKKKPIKNSISHFANSYYRWWCELDTFIQTANDLSKFEKMNPSLFTIKGLKPVGKCGLFYVCPDNERVIPIEVIGNAISNPYRAAFLAGQLSKVGINLNTINEIYHRTFRPNGKDIDLRKCISIADGKTTLFDAINGTLE